MTERVSIIRDELQRRGLSEANAPAQPTELLASWRAAGGRCGAAFAPRDDPCDRRLERQAIVPCSEPQERG